MKLDLHWADTKLIVETDGRGVHDNPYAFEEDRRRDLDLELADWHVIRLTWRQVAEQPERAGAAAEEGHTGSKRAVKCRSAGGSSTIRSPRSSPTRRATCSHTSIT